MVKIKDSGAWKYDGEKLRYDLIPSYSLYAIADIFTFGAKKYNDRNWELGISNSRLFGACMRHLWAWWACENTDLESKKSHLWHAGCCIMMLIHNEKFLPKMDDRPKYDR